MSQEKVLKTLESLGFTQLDARVYVLLAKKGPQKAGEIAEFLKMPKQTVYFIIKNLQKKGIVTSTVERPARFNALPFERVLDLFVKTKMEEAQHIQRNKDDILLDWQSIAVEKNGETSPKFAVIEGRNIIYSKIQQMMQQTKEHLSIITSVPNLVRADSFGLFDAAFEQQNRSNIQFRFLTDLSENSIEIVRSLLSKARKQKVNLEIRIPDLGLKLSRIVIRDNKETMFFINASADPATAEKDDVCLWTDCRDLVNSFVATFEDSWHNATDIQKKIAEIETGTPSPKTFVIKNADIAHKKYDEITSSAKRSILILTSSTGLVEYWKNKNQAKKWVQKGVSLRIMAPVIGGNIAATRQLLKICEVKHVPAGYIGTTIVDSQHLFQFKTPTSTRKELQWSMAYFENTIYSDDPEYVKMTENMLNNIWENAQPPSPLTLGKIIQQSTSNSKSIVSNVFDGYRTEFKKILGLSYKEEPQQGKIDEREILKKIADAVRIPAKNPEKDTVRTYGRMGTVIIYPPKKLNLPNLMFQICCANKNSSFGVSNSLTISIQTDIADQQSYLQTAFITDNPEGYNFRKAMHKNQHTAEAIYLFNKNELAVHASTNGLFAGWAVPIPLLSEKYILPPANIIFEGFGEIRTYSTELKGLLNRRLIYEFNCLEAFVTFMLPSSRYYSPATDGLLYRECIITSYPPSTLKETIVA